MPIGELAALAVVLSVLIPALRPIGRGGQKAWLALFLTILLLAPYVVGGLFLLRIMMPDQPGASDGEVVRILIVFLIYVVAGAVPVSIVSKKIQMKLMPGENK